MRFLLPVNHCGLRRWALLLAWSFALPGASGATGRVLVGLTEPLDDVILSASVSGNVSAVHVKEGSRVEQGQVLIELEKVRDELEVNRRQLALDALGGELERTRRLFQTTRSVPQEELEKKEAEYAVAKVELEMALESVRQKRIVSPITGTVTDIPHQVGEACQALQAVARVVNATQFRFVANSVPSDVVGLVEGGEATLEAPGADGQSLRLTGRITYISPVVDPASGLVKLTAVFPNPDGRVRPGVTAQLLLNHGN